MVDYITVIDKNAIAADFGAQCRNTYAGGYIHFLDKTLGMVEDWKWTFEGGNPSVSTDQNPVVQYVNPGKYKVTLTVKNSVNSSVKEKRRIRICHFCRKTSVIFTIRW